MGGRTGHGSPYYADAVRSAIGGSAGMGAGTESLTIGRQKSGTWECEQRTQGMRRILRSLTSVSSDHIYRLCKDKVSARKPNQNACG